jgi:HEAT repeat protein
MRNFRRKFLILLFVGWGGVTISAAADQPDLKTQAWELLRTGVQDEKTLHRATGVRVLSLLKGEPEAVTLACKALNDTKPEVRVAAAMALGQLHAISAIPQLKQLLSDKEVSVVLAAANALLLMKDNNAYDVYYAILTGQRKGNKGLLEAQVDNLKDPKKMAMMGFEEGIGFIPFAGLGYSAVKTLIKDDSSPVRAAAAKILTGDPDPATDETLADIAVNDKSELVCVAALDAIARRNHFAMIEKIAPVMSDESDPVRYTAAAAVLHLTDSAQKLRKKKSSRAANANSPTTRN